VTTKRLQSICETIAKLFEDNFKARAMLLNLKEDMPNRPQRVYEAITNRSQRYYNVIAERLQSILKANALRSQSAFVAM
jgi:hypothetical protein